MHDLLTSFLPQPNSLAVPYCQQAPKNSELNGLFQCQFQGADQKTFVGGLALGAAGTIPFGHTEPLNPLGSCAANPSGPIADGTQLTDITQDPGLQNVSGGSGNSSASATSTEASATSTEAATSISEAAATSTEAAATSAEAATSTSEAAATNTEVSACGTSSAATTTTAASSSNFQLQNALDAQKLNAQFATLTADSSCNGMSSWRHICLDKY